MSAFHRLVAAFMLLVGAAAAAVLGQLSANPRGPWLCMSMSACSVLATATAIGARGRG